jgi:hypothetical protein
LITSLAMKYGFITSPQHWRQHSWSWNTPHSSWKSPRPCSVWGWCCWW